MPETCNPAPMMQRVAPGGGEEPPQPGDVPDPTRSGLWERYSRQILFAPLGVSGQRALRTSHVALVGCGALGSTQAGLLARAGVGRLTLIDRDYVEASNLQRQSLFEETDALEALPKAVAAARRLHAINSEVEVRPQVADLTPENVHALLGDASVILDGTDNFETRYLLNDFSVAEGRPWIYGAVVGAQGVTFTVLPGESACLECIFAAQPDGVTENCDTAGVLNWAVQYVAAVQVAECVKLLVGARTALRRTLLSADLWRNDFRQLQPPPRDPDCRVCQQRDFQHLRGERRPHITLCGRDSVQIHEHDRVVDFAQLGPRLAAHGRVRHNAHVLKFWLDEPGGGAGLELTLFPDGRAMIKGTTDPAVARSLYARFIGS